MKESVCCIKILTPTNLVDIQITIKIVHHIGLPLTTLEAIHAWQLDQLLPMGRHLLLYQPRFGRKEKCSIVLYGCLFSIEHEISNMIGSKRKKFSLEICMRKKTIIWHKVHPPFQKNQRNVHACNLKGYKKFLAYSTCLD